MEAPKGGAVRRRWLGGFPWNAFQRRRERLNGKLIKSLSAFGLHFCWTSGELVGLIDVQDFGGPWAMCWVFWGGGQCFSIGQV